MTEEIYSESKAVITDIGSQIDRSDEKKDATNLWEIMLGSADADFSERENS